MADLGGISSAYSLLSRGKYNGTDIYGTGKFIDSSVLAGGYSVAV